MFETSNGTTVAADTMTTFYLYLTHGLEEENTSLTMIRDDEIILHASHVCYSHNNMNSSLSEMAVDDGDNNVIRTVTFTVTVITLATILVALAAVIRVKDKVSNTADDGDTCTSQR